MMSTGHCNIFILFIYLFVSILVKFLHKAGCGPPLYALFNNGMVYGYIQGETIDHVIVRDELVRK